MCLQKYCPNQVVDVFKSRFQRHVEDCWNTEGRYISTFPAHPLFHLCSEAAKNQLRS